jgi:ADP-ribosylglycohydrolase
VTSLLPSDYRERVYAGWLGKCIGVRLGAPVENWTADEIANTLGEITDFLPLPAGKLFKPDDDTAVPMILIRALEDYGLDPTAAQIGQTQLNYVADQRGTIWWGGYGVSTEHTAYLNMLHGVPAPESGSIALNGKVLAEQIGGQIFSDIWGLVAPNQPARAAELAARAASVAHDGEAIQGGRFIAALVSLAFSEPDMRTLIPHALEQVKADSEYARVVNAVLEYYLAHRAKSPAAWRDCYRFIHAEFGYDKYPGMVPIIPNAAIVVMALLYAEGDFARAVQIATMGGWDTDCNAGNVGAIMGVAVGLEGIDMRWRAPMDDLLITANLIGSRNLTDIPTCADLFCALGARMAGKDIPTRARLHFDYPGSTHAMQARTRGAQITALRQDDGALNILMRRLTKKGEAEVYVRTYCRPGDLSANYYGASFSPTICPGQTMTARIFAPENAGDMVLAAPFVWDDNSQVRHQAEAVRLQPGAWTELRYRVPPMHNALLAEAGILFRNLGEAWTGTLRLDDMDWSGAPHWSTDFALERREFDAISQWTFLRGYWRLEADGYHGSSAAPAESYTGDVAWRNVRVVATLIPLRGEEHRMNVRVQGALRSYAAGLAPGRRFVLYKNDGGYREVAAAPFAWQIGQPVTITVTAKGATFGASVEGGPTLRWEETGRPWLQGQIGLSGGSGCHMLCSHLRVEGA